MDALEGSVVVTMTLSAAGAFFLPTTIVPGIVDVNSELPDGTVVVVKTTDTGWPTTSCPDSLLVYPDSVDWRRIVVVSVMLMGSKEDSADDESRANTMGSVDAAYEVVREL